MQRLELTWIGKEEQPQVEPRILLHDPSKDYGDPDAKNMLIHGDNLLALKALEQQFAGQVKCIYIDPPYNTGAAFEYYDDNLEHSTWLKLMHSRLQILRNLFSDDGFFCVQIDDSEGHYLKVMLDELFGRNNYLTTFYIQVRYPNKTLAEDSDYQKIIEQVRTDYLFLSELNPVLNKILMFDNFENFITGFESVHEASEITGLKEASIYDVLCKRRKQNKGFVFKYYDDIV